MSAPGTKTMSRQAHESLLTTRARRQGLRIVTSDDSDSGHGGYQLVDEGRGQVVIGEGFWLTLDDVEAWLSGAERRGVDLFSGTRP